MGLLFDIYNTLKGGVKHMDNFWGNVPGSPYYEMSDTDYIVQVLGFENPNDYWMDQDTCQNHRERLLTKAG